LSMRLLGSQSVPCCLLLPFVESNRKVTYVLVFVEDVECFDGRHVVVDCPSLCQAPGMYRSRLLTRARGVVQRVDCCSTHPDQIKIQRGHFMFTRKVRAPSQTSDLRPCDNLVFKILTYIQDRLLGCLSSTDPDRQHAFRTHSPRTLSASQNL
jgi:hypothetical protein